nr:MAG TPA: hypothetical protein [Caudoviricetes sp.]
MTVHKSEKFEAVINMHKDLLSMYWVRCNVLCIQYRRKSNMYQQNNVIKKLQIMTRSQGSR